MTTPLKLKPAELKKLERNLKKVQEVERVPMKKPRTLIKELRIELRHFQMQARIEARALRASREKCKQIGAMMRKLQQTKRS